MSNTLRNRFTFGALAMAAIFAASSASAQDDRRVKIINETDYVVVAFYGSNAGSQDWEEDILGQDVLRPGQSVVINFDDGSGYCKFDFLAKFEDGDQVEKRGIDVCKTSVFRLTE